MVNYFFSPKLVFLGCVCVDKSNRPGQPTVSGRKNCGKEENTERATITSALNMEWQN